MDRIKHDTNTKCHTKSVDTSPVFRLASSHTCVCDVDGDGYGDDDRVSTPSRATADRLGQ